MPLWHEAYLEVRMTKHVSLGTPLEVDHYTIIAPHYNYNYNCNYTAATTTTMTVVYHTASSSCG